MVFMTNSDALDLADPPLLVDITCIFDIPDAPPLYGSQVYSSSICLLGCYSINQY